MTVKSIGLWRLKQMNTSSLSPTAWLSESASRNGLGNGFWIDTRNTRLLSVKVKCPDPWVASHDQKPDMGIVSGIKSPPLARTPPPHPHRIYIDRCIRSSRWLWRSKPIKNGEMFWMNNNYNIMITISRMGDHQYISYQETWNIRRGIWYYAPTLRKMVLVFIYRISWIIKK